jgi:flagellar biosynthesis/type III secretory pathway chaperone
MIAPAPVTTQSPLESALHDVYATLRQLLVAADEQYAALVAHDRDWIERVTRQQERLASRLARAETRRMQALDGASLSQLLTSVSPGEADRIESMQVRIAAAVTALKSRQSQTASLLNDTIDLTNRTIAFLQRLLSPSAPAYGRRGSASLGGSVLVDSRA